MHRLTAGLFALAVCTGQSYPPAWNLAHPDAKALIGFNVHGFRQSALSQPLGSGIEKGDFGMFHLPKLPAVEILKEVDQVLISSPGGKAQNPPFLMVLTGHFSAELQLRAKEAKSGLTVLDEETILMGDATSIKGAIARHERNTKSSNALLARAAALAPNRDFWLVATAPPVDFQAAGIKARELAAYIKGIDVGISVHDGLDFELSFASKSPEAAQEIAQYIGEQMKTAMAGKSQDAVSDEIARKVQVSSEGTQARVTFVVSKEELEREMRKLKESRAAAALQEAKPQTIKIVGLDEGVKEIPLPPKKKN
jgi:hypothetical protein